MNKSIDVYNTSIYTLEDVVKFIGDDFFDIHDAEEYLRYVTNFPEPTISFNQVVEIFILSALHPFRFTCNLALALNLLAQKFENRHPLLDERFGLNEYLISFIVDIHLPLNLSGVNLDLLLHSFKHKLSQVAYFYETSVVHPNISQLFPIVSLLGKNINKGRADRVVIDPKVNFGKPYLLYKGIPTDAIAQRFISGEWIEDIKEDFKITKDDVDLAVLFEGRNHFNKYKEKMNQE